jgi:mannose-1-phosphate guanylyltransferase
MAVVTADHEIGEPHLFRSTIDASLHVAETQEALVTHGIVPTRPDTGFGYIEESSEPGEAFEVVGIRMAKAEAFHEKPNEEKAEDFIATGHYFWNSGMFFWRVDTFVNEMQLARPEMAEAIRAMAKSIGQQDKGTTRTLFEKLEGISIDYALMEHSQNVIVVRAEYPWDDVGSWPSLDRTRERDEQGNVGIGNPVILDSENTIVYNDLGEDAMSVSVIGVRDLVVVVSEDGILVVPKDKAMHVRDAVKELRARGSKHV